MRSARNLSFLFLVALFTTPASADTDEQTCYINIDPHPCASAKDPVKACERALEDDPYDMQTRLSLCGMHLQDESNNENKIDAYIVVKKGIELCGSDRYACQRFKYAKSMIEESEEGGRRQQVISARERCDYGRDLCESRLTSNLGVRGCDLAMICDAEEPVLHIKKAEKLLARNHPAGAVGALITAANLNPQDAAIRAKLAEAQKLRAKLAAKCTNRGTLEDCNNALLPGEPDEFDVQYRRGQLLVVQDREPAALQAFMNAQSVNPDNKDLAQNLLALLDPELRQSPNDAALARAQGLALRAVGSTNDSILALRRAARLNPDDDAIRQSLAAARGDRARSVERNCLSGDSPKSCYAVILKGEPDEAQIRAHVAGLLRDADDLDGAYAEAQKAVRLDSGDKKIAALFADIGALRAPPEPAPAEPVVAVQPERLVDVRPDNADRVIEPQATDTSVIGIVPVIFSNSAREDGRTY